MVTKDMILRACSVCDLVELEDNTLLPQTDTEIKKLIANNYQLSHTVLSRQCAKDFYKEDFAEFEELFILGKDRDGKIIYETCQ
jgi:hypothetical protein